jgi:uncharacterized protein with NAD-binding domain and iron-sulfur cluster
MYKHIYIYICIYICIYIYLLQIGHGSGLTVYEKSTVYGGRCATRTSRLTDTIKYDTGIYIYIYVYIYMFICVYI